MKWLLVSLFLTGLVSAKSPNIILIITDDQGYPAVGANGTSWLKTPNMDKLRKTGAAFDRFLVSPTCSPTRSALMTGRHPMKNGITHTTLSASAWHLVQ
jgi:arylsulfatase A-like enzyme